MMHELFERKLEEIEVELARRVAAAERREVLREVWDDIKSAYPDGLPEELSRKAYKYGCGEE